VALLRLSRYDAASTAPLLREAWADPVWQVRCFAVHEAARIGLVPGDDDLARESDPFVIRAVLRHARQLPAERIERPTRRLLESNDLEERSSCSAWRSPPRATWSRCGAPPSSGLRRCCAT
jgi:hypothetical protein